MSFRNSSIDSNVAFGRRNNVVILFILVGFLRIGIPLFCLLRCGAFPTTRVLMTSLAEVRALPEIRSLLGGMVGTPSISPIQVSGNRHSKW